MGTDVVDIDTLDEQSLRLVEIQESVLPEDEWIIGISNMDYFNGIGYSMPIPLRFDKSLGYQRGLLVGGRVTADLPQSSNIDDQIILSDATINDDDPLFKIRYKIAHDDLSTSSRQEVDGIEIEIPQSENLIANLEHDMESLNLYAFIPGIFYCSGQQTSVDAVLIEVTQKQLFGMTISSFRPEDVRPLDISTGMILDKSGYGKTVPVSLDTLGSFHSQSFLKDAGLSEDLFEYSREIELAMRLSQWMPTKVLKQAYVSSSFLRNRIIRLLEDIEFFGLLPRRRVYVRNQKHPFGTIVEAQYLSYDAIIDLGSETGIACPDEIDLEMELTHLTFAKSIGPNTEADIESAIMDMFQFFDSKLEGKTNKEDVLLKLTKELTS